MRLFTTTEVARPAYNDRQPIPILANYLASGVAPHAMTVRASYTPPDGYAAFIESIVLQVIRQSAAGVLSYSEAFIYFLPYYGGTYQLLPCTLFNNTVAQYAQQSLTSYGYMAFGDTLQIKTQDTSTGGFCAYSGLIKGTEFLY